MLTRAPQRLSSKVMYFREADELSDYLASLNLQHYAPQLHQEDIHCLADLRILTARDLAACGVPHDDAAAILAQRPPLSPYRDPSANGDPSEAPTPVREAPAFGALQAQAPAWEPPRQYEAPYKQRAREFQN